MTCEDCDAEQQMRMKQYFVRVGTANVLFFACEKHAKEMLERLRKGVEKK